MRFRKGTPRRARTTAGGVVVSGVRLLAEALEARTLLSALDAPVRTLDNPSHGTDFNFGAAAAVSGNLAIVGSPNWLTGTGRAYSFNLDTGQFLGTYDNPTMASNDHFAASVAASGGWVVIGAPHDDHDANTIQNVGRAYAYPPNNGPLQVIDIPNGGGVTRRPGDEFGGSVAVAGNYAVIGAMRYDANTIADAGAAFIYNLSTRAIRYLPAVSPVTSGLFGGSVATDGVYAAVSNANANGNRGAVAIYNVAATSGGPLYSIMPNPARIDDNFGHQVAMSNGYLVVGSFRDQDLQGVVEIYRLGATSATRVAALTRPAFPTQSWDLYTKVAAAGDYAIVGLPTTGTANAGEAHVYELATGRFVRTLTNPAPEVATPSDQQSDFGTAVAASSQYLVVGSPGTNHGFFEPDSGNAYAYKPGQVWIELVDASGNVLPNNTPLLEGEIARFRVNRNGAQTVPLTVYFDISGNAGPTDFGGGSLVDGFVTIPAGQAAKVIEIPLTADDRPDVENQFDNERLTLSLDTDQNVFNGQTGNPTGDLVRDAAGRWVPRPGGQGADLAYRVLPDVWTASIEIVDKDTKYVGVDTQDATGGERSGDGAQFTIRRGGDLSQPLAVQLDLSGTAALGEDYTLLPLDGSTTSQAGSSLTVTIPARANFARISMLPRNDAAQEGIEWIHAELLESTAAYTLATDPQKRQSRVGFIDDDMGSVLLRNVVGSVVEGSGQRAQFRVDRGGLAYDDQTITVNVALGGLGTTASLGDYEVVRADGTVVAPTSGGFYAVTLAGTDTSPTPVNSVDLFVRPLDDSQAESDERIEARLISGSAYLAHPTIDRAEVVIVDDADRPVVTVQPTDATATETNQAIGEFTVHRQGGIPSQPQTVFLSVGGTAAYGIDYSLSAAGTPYAQFPGFVTIPAGQTSLSLTVHPRQDRQAEDTETIVLGVLAGGPYSVDPEVATATAFLTDYVPGGTLAGFTWSMPERTVDANNDGLIDVIPNTFEYANPFADTSKPAGHPDRDPLFGVEFDAATSVGAAAYAWTIRDAAGNLVDWMIKDQASDTRRSDLHRVPTFTEREFRAELAEGTYVVTLTVTGTNDATTQESQIVEVDDILVVSFGDSMASGEGVPDVPANNDISRFLSIGTLPEGKWANGGPDDEDDADHAAAHRSSKAAPALTAGAMEWNDPKSSVTFVFLAQSGASVAQGFVGPFFEGEGPLSQLDQAIGTGPGDPGIVGDRSIDTVMMSFGANDIAFHEPLLAYVARAKLRIAFVFEKATRSLDDIAQDEFIRLAQMPGVYAALNDAIVSRLAPRMSDAANVFITGYHDPTGGDDGQPAPLMRDYSHNLWIGGAQLVAAIGITYLSGGLVIPSDLPLQVDAEEAGHAREHFARPMSDAVGLAADTYGWNHVPIFDKFRTHGYGASDTWVVSASDSRRLQGGNVFVPFGAGHPNAAGHRAIAEENLKTFLGDSRPTATLPPVVEVVEGSTVVLTPTVVGGHDLKYEWDLSFDGRAFAPDAAVRGPSATVSADALAYPAFVPVAVRVTDRLGRSSYAVTTVRVVNGSSGRDPSEVSSVTVGEPFRLPLARLRHAADPVRYWRVDWGDGTDPDGDGRTGETVPADWGSRTHVYTSAGRFTYKVWLADAGGEVAVEGGAVTVIQDDPFPRVAVTAPDADASEVAGNKGRFRFTRSAQQISLPLSIQIAFATGPAVNGVDYTGPSNNVIPLSVFFPAGQTEVFVDVFPVADRDDAEGPEDVEIRILLSSLYAVDVAAAVVRIADGPSIDLGAITGRVYDDADGDNARDAGEAPLAGWQVVLDLDKDGNVDAGEPAATTDAGGAYSHSFRPPGTYQLLLVPQVGWVATTPPRRTAVVPPGATAADVDFGVARPVTLRGSVFVDGDVDGVRDAAESGRGGAGVFVDVNGNGRLDAGEPVGAADAAGAYQVLGAAPGRLLVRAVAGTGWANTGGEAGGARVVQTTGGSTVLDIDHGQRPVLPEITAFTATAGSSAAAMALATDVTKGAGGASAAATAVVAGEPLTLTATGVDPWTTLVRFYLESDGQPGLQTGGGGDTPFGNDAVSGDGFALSFRAGLEAGSYMFYAAADDADGQLGTPKSAEVSVTGSPGPTVVSVTALTQSVREGGSLTAVFEVRRTGGNAETLTVNLTSPASAGHASASVAQAVLPTTVTIPAGQDVVRVDVPVPDDGVAGGAEPVRVAVGPGDGYTVDAAQATAEVFVRDAATTPAVVSVLSTRFDGSESLHVVDLALSENLAGSLTAEDAVLRNLTTGEDVPASDLVLEYDPVLGVARFAVPGAGGGTGTLADGTYRLTLKAAGVAGPLGQPLDGNGDGTGGDDFTFEFTAAPVLPSWVEPGGSATWDPGTKTLTVTGPVTITADAGFDAPMVIASGAAAVLTINTPAGSRVNLGGLWLSNGASAAVASAGAARTLVIADGAKLTLDATSNLDLTDNALVVRNAGQSAASAVHTSLNGLVRSAFSDFAWTGKGVSSSTAQADVATGVPSTLGILLNNDGAGGPLFYGPGTDQPTFMGAAVDSNTVMVRFTHLGDGDLNGVVDSVDFALFQAGYTGAAPHIGFAFGDYDYNGVIDSVDFGLFQAGYQAGAGAAATDEDDEERLTALESLLVN